MERVTWKLPLPYVKEMVNGNLLYGSGNSNRDSVSTYRCGVGREMGGRFKREGHPTPVFLPGKSHGGRSLVGCSPWGRWESDTTE